MNLWEVPNMVGKAPGQLEQKGALENRFHLVVNELGSPLRYTSVYVILTSMPKTLKTELRDRARGGEESIVLKNYMKK